jgi:hypothetical protein
MPDELEPEPPPPEAEDWSFEGRLADDQGLPTDPEAYQDGGMAVAATALTVVEADLLVAILRGRDIPAWVDAPRAAIVAAPAGPVSIVVPLGRLADAQEALADRVFLDDPAETPEMRAQAQRRDARWRIVMSVAFLTFGSVMGLAGLFLIIGGSQQGRIDYVGAGIPLLALGFLSVTVAIIGLKNARRQPEDGR